MTIRTLLNQRIDMDGDRESGKGDSDFSSADATKSPNGTDVINILDERIENLREAIAEIDAALDHRKKLNVAFLEQIQRETDEVKRHLNKLNEPWATGFYPEVEFLRHSFHKSLTSRAKESRAEQLKYWENGVNLAKERRKFLDELKELLAAKKRLRA